MSGADYSYARPGGAALAAAGVTDVGRYLAPDGRGITAGEYQDLRAHGLNVWLVREGSATGMLGGYAQGAHDAQVAVQQIAAAGIPGNPLVYAAADWDVQDSQFPAVDAYLQGFASVVGLDRTGIYAGLHYCNHAHAAGLAVRFWQAGATSWNHGESAKAPISIVQTTGTPQLPGMDLDIVLDPSYASLGATLLTTQKDNDMPQYNDTQNAIYWPNGNGYYSSYEPGVYNALRYWIINGKELAGTEGTVQQRVYEVINNVAASNVQALTTTVASTVAAVIPHVTSGGTALSDADLQKITNAATAAAVAALPKSYTLTVATDAK